MLWLPSSMRQGRAGDEKDGRGMMCDVRWDIGKTDKIMLFCFGKNGQNVYRDGWQAIVIWECQLKPALIDHTMRELELLLNDNLLSLYKHHNPIPYGTEEDAPLPMAAESNQP